MKMLRKFALLIALAAAMGGCATDPRINGSEWQINVIRNAKSGVVMSDGSFVAAGNVAGISNAGGARMGTSAGVGLGVGILSGLFDAKRRSELDDDVVEILCSRPDYVPIFGGLPIPVNLGYMKLTDAQRELRRGDWVKLSKNDDGKFTIISCSLPEAGCTKIVK